MLVVWEIEWGTWLSEPRLRCIFLSSRCRITHSRRIQSFSFSPTSAVVSHKSRARLLLKTHGISFHLHEFHLIIIQCVIPLRQYCLIKYGIHRFSGKYTQCFLRVCNFLIFGYLRQIVYRLVIFVNFMFWEKKNGITRFLR